MDIQIPQTGRIGRFAKIVEKDVEQEVLLRILQDADRYVSSKPNKKAAWWRGTIERLEQEIGTQAAIKIMRACGRKCCAQGNRRTAKRLMRESASLQEFLEKSSQYGVKEGEIEYTLKEEQTIVGHFYRCFCGQVKQTGTTFPNRTYCYCSAEFHKQYFEAALGTSVTVEIVQSIINGAEMCEFLIHLHPGTDKDEYTKK